MKKVFVLILIYVFSYLSVSENFSRAKAEQSGIEDAQDSLDLLWIKDTESKFHSGVNKGAVADFAPLQWDTEGNIVYATRVSNDYVTIRSIQVDGNTMWRNDVYLPSTSPGWQGSNIGEKYGMNVNPDGNIYVYGRGDGVAKVYALNSKNGEILWDKEDGCSFVPRKSGGLIQACFISSAKYKINIYSSNGLKEKELQVKEHPILANTFNGSLSSNSAYQQTFTDHFFTYSENNLSVYDDSGTLLYTIDRNNKNIPYVYISKNSYIGILETVYNNKDVNYNLNYYGPDGNLIVSKAFTKYPYYVAFLGDQLVYIMEHKSFSISSFGTEQELKFSIPYKMLPQDRSSSYYVRATENSESKQGYQIVDSNLKILRKINTKFSKDSEHNLWEPFSENKISEFNRMSPNPPEFNLIDLKRGLVIGTRQIYNADIVNEKMLIWAAKIPYYDIINHWAEDPIRAMINKGLISGFDDKGFHPDETMTREQFVSLVVRVFNLQSSTSRLPFEDVPITQWSYPYIQAALQNGVISEDRKFKPTEPITRLDMAKFLSNVLHLETSASTNKEFADMSSLSKNDIKIISPIINKGIINGYDDFTFRPNQTATRAEAISIINRAIGNSGF